MGALTPSSSVTDDSLVLFSPFNALEIDLNDVLLPKRIPLSEFVDGPAVNHPLVDFPIAFTGRLHPVHRLPP